MNTMSARTLEVDSSVLQLAMTTLCGMMLIVTRENHIVKRAYERQYRTNTATVFFGNPSMLLKCGFIQHLSNARVWKCGRGIFPTESLLSFLVVTFL